MDARRHRRRWAVLVVVVALAAACRVPPPRPTPPGPVVGPNPPIESTPGATTTVVRYGPWTAPAATGTGHHGSGMVEDVRVAIDKPCQNCYLTAARPQLRYLDGTVANTDTGLWLHHFALFNSGAVDARCAESPAKILGETFYTGANERTHGRFAPGVGYRVKPTDVWSVLVDIMNTSATPRDVVFEMTFEWVPASTRGMLHARPVFIDVGEACVDSNVPAGTGQYSRKTTWPVTVPGRIVGIAPHVHDGGTRVTVRNLTTGAVICDSDIYYGGPGYEPAADDGHGAVHFSGADQCVARSPDRPVAVIRAGDVLEVEAFYDADEHPHPADEPVMGLVFFYVIPA